MNSRNSRLNISSAIRAVRATRIEISVRQRKVKGGTGPVPVPPFPFLGLLGLGLGPGMRRHGYDVPSASFAVGKDAAGAKAYYVPLGDQLRTWRLALPQLPTFPAHDPWVHGGSYRCVNPNMSVCRVKASNFSFYMISLGSVTRRMRRGDMDGLFFAYARSSACSSFEFGAARPIVNFRPAGLSVSSIGICWDPNTYGIAGCVLI